MVNSGLLLGRTMSVSRLAEKLAKVGAAALPATAAAFDFIRAYKPYSRPLNAFAHRVSDD
jgi:hypothetical protein